MAPTSYDTQTKSTCPNGGSRALTVKKHAQAFSRKDTKPKNPISLTILTVTASWEAGIM